MIYTSRHHSHEVVNIIGIQASDCGQLVISYHVWEYAEGRCFAEVEKSTSFCGLKRKWWLWHIRFQMGSIGAWFGFSPGISYVMECWPRWQKSSLLITPILQWGGMFTWIWCTERLLWVSGIKLHKEFQATTYPIISTQVHSSPDVASEKETTDAKATKK